MLKRIFGPGRALVESIENRILVGIAAFMATIVILGWVAINEPGRMQAFDRQFNARSTEKGAALFVSACATCHGPQGHGILGRAPALNNPQLFGHDYFPELTAQVTALETERGAIEAELADTVNPVSDARREEIESRLEAIDAEIEDLAQQMRDQLPPAVLAVGYDPLNFDRLEQTDWGGGLENFIISTITSGRPVSNAYWPQPMPAWGQVSGGSLRPDQIRDLARYIMNWDREWTLDDLTAVRQFAVAPCNQQALPGATGACEDLLAGSAADGGAAQAPALTAGDIAGTDVDAVLAALETVEGDAAAGQNTYQAQGCTGCHTTGVGPDLAGTYTRVENERLADPALAGYTAEQYLVESIINPSAFVAPGFADGVMPASFGTVLTVQDIANLVAYLETQTE